MALPAIGDGEQVGDGNTSETLNVGRSGQALQIGGAASTLVAFHGASPVDQAAVITSVTTTAPVSGAFGFETSAQAISMITAVNALIAMAKEKGLVATS